VNAPTNLAVTILASAVTAAVVTGAFALLAQKLERSTRRKEIIFTKSVELAKANRDFVHAVAKDMGGGTIHDYAVYAEMYYWLLTELHDRGRLPENWRTDIGTKFGEL
jgi:hypothetical protein